MLVARLGNSINNLHHKLANTLNVALLFRIARLAILNALAKLGSVDLAVQVEQLELGFAQPVHDTEHAL